MCMASTGTITEAIESLAARSSSASITARPNSLRRACSTSASRAKLCRSASDRARPLPLQLIPKRQDDPVVRQSRAQVALSRRRSSELLTSASNAQRSSFFSIRVGQSRGFLERRGARAL